jgi:AcrR family transcriptional regulator
MVRPTTSNNRLTVDDWVTAALTVLAEEGIGHVKITRLCQELGVTKGSFYWHFTDLDALLTAVAERWGAGQDRARHELRSLATVEPTERLARASRVFFDQKLAPLDAAMRTWAQSDERARPAVKASDRYIFEFALTAFRDLGFTPAEADLRAKVLYYAGVGLEVVGPLGRRNPAHQSRELLDLLTGR